MTYYKLEIYNPVTRKYEYMGTYLTIERAEIMFNKPYVSRHTRRLTKFSEDVLYVEKGKK